MLDAIRDFLRLETAGGLLLMAAATLALVAANSPAGWIYQLLIDLPVEVRVGPLEIAKPLILWINDGLMAIFFFLVGLELKREVLDGELSDPQRVLLPGLGAIGGMAVPSLIYTTLNLDNPVAIAGWAIPAATDIAFALAILSLLGSRVPLALKIFLVSIAIFDDLGAIVIIALFYTEQISLLALIVASSCLVPLLWLNRAGVVALAPYLLIGLVMWTAVLKSGVHATLAGVVLAAFIPLRDPANPDRSPLRELEKDLHTAVAFGVLPLFGFVNAGIPLAGVGLDALVHPVSLGVLLGLFVGKQIGVFSFCWVAVRLGWARLPEGVSWAMLYGAALLCGVGFTMSLFIGSLAFQQTGVNQLFDERLGIIVGSLLSGLAAYLVLRLAVPTSAVEPG